MDSESRVLHGGVDGLYTVHVVRELVEVANSRVLWVEEAVLLVRSDNDDEAESLAREEYASAGEFLGKGGVMKEWRLAKVLSVDRVDPDLADLGLEVYSEFLSPEEASRRAKFRASLDANGVY